MIRTYFKIAVRNFLKEKFYSALNILGLSIGIAVALIITVFIAHESSFDRFHTNAERIFRIGMRLDIAGNSAKMNSTFPAMAEALETAIPEVEQAVRLYLLNGRIFKSGEKVLSEDKVLYADADFFKVFDFKTLAGNNATALTKPYQVMLTPALAKKYFNTQNWWEVVGQEISINETSFQVSGIIEEAPENSHVTFTAIASMLSLRQGKNPDWDNLNLSTYVLVRSGNDMQDVMNKLTGVFRKHIKDYDKMPEHGVVMQPIGQRLTDIHLKSNLQGEFEAPGSVSTLYIFGSVGLVVLILASVNFVNLVTARSANRAKEVGVRKVLGSASRQLMFQFITECIMLVALATLLALGIVEIVRGPFTILLGTSLPFDTLLSGEYFLYLILFVLVMGIIAGSYPAFFLSSFRPAVVLKGKLRSGFRGSKLRNALVATQFIISIVLITCTLIVQRQLNFVRSKKLGFDKDNVIVIDNTNRLKSQLAYINAAKQIRGVMGIGAATFRPVDDYDGMLITTAQDKDNRKLVNFSRVDEDYLSVMNYEFVEGRNFSRDFPSDSAAVVINQKAAEFLFGEHAMGSKVNNGIDYSVIGIIKDSNFESLKNEIRPLVFFLHPNQRFLHVRIEPGNYAQTIASLEKVWKQQTSEIPFSYSFLDETYDNLYKQETRLGLIFNIFTALALVIACLGLVGLAAYTAEQRRKEISIRKVLGASASTIVQLLSVDFVRVIAIAFILAVPLAYYLMDQWLDTFAYKVDVPIYMLIVGGIIVIVIAMAAVSFQSIRAALVNPVDSLKEE
jgi:putative ABC transport system permease protein